MPLFDIMSKDMVVLDLEGGGAPVLRDAAPKHRRILRGRSPSELDRDAGSPLTARPNSPLIFHSLYIVMVPHSCCSPFIGER